ncbi:MAG: DUF1080 domain-containing protein [Bryobacteraceae bacterium]
MLRSVAALGVIAVAITAQAQHNRLTPAEKKAGWKLLFDGKSFAGWDDPALRNPPGASWTIEDGAIKSLANPKIREDLISKETFGDFELTFEWKIASGSNSGVKYMLQKRVMLDQGKHTKGQKFEEFLGQEMARPVADRKHLVGQGEEYTVAFEYQVIDDTKHADALRGAKYQAGALYSMVGASQRAAKAVGEWNQGRIVRKGMHVEHWLNGVKVVDSNLDVDDVKHGLEGRWTTSHPVYRLLTELPNKTTPILLQNHNDPAWFRDIKIRPLH